MGGCYCNRPLLEEIGLWIPFIIFSGICVGIPVAVGSNILIVLISYGSVVLFFILIFLYLHKFFNYSYFPHYAKSTRRLDGQWAIVTGANSGSGYCTARELIKYGCNVIITCRSEKKANTTIERITRELQGNSNNKYTNIGKIDYVLLDLMSKKSIDNAINDIYSKNVDISILVNNAGAALDNVRMTEDNIEGMWQSDYLSPFYFTEKLMPNIKNTAQKLKYGRIVNVASQFHWAAKIEHFEAFMDDSKRGNKTIWDEIGGTYGSAKCAQILHAMAYQEILNNEIDSNGNKIGEYLYITSNNPGFIDSAFYQPSTYPFCQRIIWSIIYPLMRTFAMVSSLQAAQQSLHLIFENDLKLIKPGMYHSACQPQNTATQSKEIFDTQIQRLYDESKRIWPIEDNNSAYSDNSDNGGDAGDAGDNNGAVNSTVEEV